jgi:predicted aspartyl protease
MSVQPPTPFGIPPGLMVNAFTVAVPAVAPISFMVPAVLAPHAPGDLDNPAAAMSRFELAAGGAFPHKGVFDTGATCSVISSSLANKLRLPIVGRSPMTTASETIEAPKHYVNFLLPNNTMISMCRVLAAPLSGCDFLFGMDIISKGDVSIVSRQGFMVLTFTMYLRHGRISSPPAMPPRTDDTSFVR